MDHTISLVHNVDYLFDKGVVLKFYEKNGKNTMFKKKGGVVFVKGRNIRPTPRVDNDGWEVKPLDFQDWWVDILVDGLCTYITIVRQLAQDEVLVWLPKTGYFNWKAHLLPPPTITYCNNNGDEKSSQCSLRIIALKTVEEQFGHKHVEDVLSHTFDKEMTKAFNRPCVWWTYI